MAGMNASNLPEGSIVIARCDPADYPGDETYHPAGTFVVVFVKQPSEAFAGRFRWTCGMQLCAESTVQKALDGGGRVLDTQEPRT